MYRLKYLVVVGSVALLGGCASGNNSNSADAADAASSERVIGDAPPIDPRPDGRADLDASVDAAMDGPDARLPDAGAPTLQIMRGALHVHSAYSHDACDGKGISGGVVNAACVAELRQAICDNRFDFVALTDHPSNMKSYPQNDVLLYKPSAGDVLVTQGGKTVANRMKCPSGATALISMGFEAKHMMPLGLDAHPGDPSHYDGADDAVALSKMKSQIAALQQLGAVVTVAHSEETDLSAQRIVDAGYDAMEWYNPHGNFQTVLGSDTLSVDISKLPQLIDLVGRLSQLSEFFAGSTSGAHPDLALMLLLDALPQAGFDKWRAVQGQRPVTGVLGSDVHRNISVDLSMCAGPLLQAACSVALGLVENALSITLPASVRSLILSGGSITMSDGLRFDSYARVLRWLENRVLVPNKSASELSAALRAGRVFGVFTLFGDPGGFAYSARPGAGGATLQLGDSGSGPLMLRVEPVALAPTSGGVPFSGAQAAQAEILARIYRSTASGTQLVREQVLGAAAMVETVSAAGAYHVELWIKPRHMRSRLGGLSAKADTAYLWVITNPIRLSAP